MAHNALGRGLNALFSQSKPPSADPSIPASASTLYHPNEVKDISVGMIKPNRHQPRTSFDEESLKELADSIKLHGLAQPLIVTETPVSGEYELVAGERRLRAAKMAAMATVPCLVKKLSNRERFELALVENLQRQDLNAYEEAVALDGLMKEFNLTQEEAAEAVGKSRSTVANVLRFLKLHESVQSSLRGGAITEGHAKVLAGIPEHAEQLRWLEEIIHQTLTVRELENLLAKGKIKKKGGATPETQKFGEIMKFEEEFQRLLGRRVEIQSKGKKGWLRFAFYSPWDFEVLCQKLGLLPGKPN